MPVDRSRYPANWKQISQRIRFEVAGNRCQFCDVPNGALIVRSVSDPYRYLIHKSFNNRAEYQWPDGRPAHNQELLADFQSKPIRVVLTVAHLNHDTADNSDDNLRALCQRCHNRHDVEYRKKNRAATHASKKQAAIEAAGQQPLFDTEVS